MNWKPIICAVVVSPFIGYAVILFSANALEKRHHTEEDTVKAIRKSESAAGEKWLEQKRRERKERDKKFAESIREIEIKSLREHHFRRGGTELEWQTFLELRRLRELSSIPPEPDD